MVRTIEEITKALTSMFGDTPTDDNVKLLEDVTDTYKSMSADGQDDLKKQLDEATAKCTEWEQKFTDNDAQWRKRYIDRFEGKPVDEIPEVKKTLDADKSTTISIDDLFTVN